VALWRWVHPLPKISEVRRWADTGQWARADSAITDLVGRRPRDGETLLLAGRVAAGRGEFERCRELLRRVPSNSPLKAEALLREAQAAQAISHATDAEAAWRELLRLTESNPSLGSVRLTAHAELFSLLALERRHEEAERVLWQMYPDHREKWRVLIGFVRLNAHGAPSGATIKLLQQIVERDSSNFHASRALAMCDVETLQWDRAISLATICLELEPNDPASFDVLLECNIRLKQWDEVERMDAQVDWDTAGARTHRLRAEYFESTGKLDQAEVHYRRSLDENPYDLAPHYRLAQLLQRRDDAAAAKHHLDEFHRLKAHKDALAQFVTTFPQSTPEDWTPPEAQTCIGIAAHCAGLGRVDEARGWLREALLQQPRLPEAVKALEQLQQ
jgi:tetratricopeptide (TPR) repeat protein